MGAVAPIVSLHAAREAAKHSFSAVSLVLTEGPSRIPAVCRTAKPADGGSKDMDETRRDEAGALKTLALFPVEAGKVTTAGSSDRVALFT